MTAFTTNFLLQELTRLLQVILSDEGVDRWLSGAKFEELKDLLASYQSDDLKWYPVDKKVGCSEIAYSYTGV